MRNARTEPYRRSEHVSADVHVSLMMSRVFPSRSSDDAEENDECAAQDPSEPLQEASGSQEASPFMSGETGVDETAAPVKDKIFNSPGIYDAVYDTSSKEWQHHVERYCFWGWRFMHWDETYLNRDPTTNIYEMFRKDLPKGSFYRKPFDDEILKYIQKAITPDEDVKTQASVEDESVNHMEVEESHSVEKDIATDFSLEEDDSADEDVVQEVQPKTYKEMKEGLRSLAPKRSTKKESSSISYVFLKMFFFLVVPLSIVLVSLVFREQSYQHSTVFANVTVELKKRIYGQDRAVEAVGEYLRLDEPFLKVIALVGGTGVGKSYTIEIVESNFPKYSVRRYFPPIDVTMNDVSFSFLYPKLIVLENLKEHNLAHVVRFLKTREKVADNQYITVLAVFNVEHMDDDLTRSIDLDRSAGAIRNSFADENLDVKVITYEPLGEDVLEKCIADAVQRSGMTLFKHDIEFIKQELVMNNAGCKGAYSKVQLIGRR